MLEPPPPKLKKIRMARAYSYNKKGELVLRPKPVTKKRPRTFSYRKGNRNFANVSVKRGLKELTGQDRRIRIYELLYFIPTALMKALTPKQLDVLLQAHRCSICQKVFRLQSGVKFHMKDIHENRTLLSYFKKIEDVNNNNKENVESKALDESTAEKDKNNQSVLVRKHSIKNYFNVRKAPRYVAKPLGLTPLKSRTRQETPNTNNKNNSPEQGVFMRITPLLKRKSSTSGKEQTVKENTKIVGTKPKLMSEKTWQKKKVEVIGDGATQDTPPKDKAPSAAASPNCAAPSPAISPNSAPAATLRSWAPPPGTPRRPKLMTPKNWRKRVEALTPEINKVEADEVTSSTVADDEGADDEVSSSTVADDEVFSSTVVDEEGADDEVSSFTAADDEVFSTTVADEEGADDQVFSSTVASAPTLSYKPKLMTKKKWRERKMLQENEVISDVNDKFDLSLLYKE